MITFAVLFSTIAFVAPEWAGPANTALLIVLTLVTKRNTQKLKKVHEDVSSAAAAGLAAAEAAAHAAVASRDAARVSKDIGGMVRRNQIPPTSEH